MTDLLALTALSQVVLYLWYTGRITGAVAASGFAGAFLFAALARAVREVFAERATDTSLERAARRAADSPEKGDRPVRKVAVRYR